MLKIWMVYIIMICLSQGYAAEVNEKEQEPGTLVELIQSQIIMGSTSHNYPVNVRMQLLGHDSSNYHANEGVVLDYFNEEQKIRDISKAVAHISVYHRNKNIAHQFVKLPEFEGMDQAGQVYSINFSVILHDDRIETDIVYVLQECQPFDSNLNKF